MTSEGRVELFREGVPIGTADRFSRWMLKTHSLAACTFWSRAELKPRDIIDARLENGLELRLLIFMRPPPSRELLRVSALILGQSKGEEWKEALEQVNQDQRLQRLLETEESQWA